MFSFHCSKQFLNSLIWMPFSASAVFYFTSPTSCLCLRNFSSGDTEFVAWGEIRWIGRMGHRGHTIFGQRLVNTQQGVGRCTHNSPIMKHQCVERVYKKKLLKQNAAFHNSSSWYTGMGGFLKHSPSGWSLYYKGPAFQKTILGGLGCPCKGCLTKDRL